MTKTKSPKARLAGRIAVLPRSYCRLERIWMPKADREGLEALRLQLQQEASEQQETFFIEPSPLKGAGFMNVWMAERSNVDHFSGVKRLWAPEPFLRLPATGPCRLLACIEGFEGQIWEKGQLVSSRWWPDQPDHSMWAEFVDGTDISIGLPASDEAIDWHALPPAERVGWRKDVSLLDLGKDSLARVISPAKAAVLILICLSAPAGMMAGTYARLYLHNRAVEAEIEGMAVRSDAIERSQRIAFDARKRADSLATMGDTFAVIDALTTLKTAAGDQPVEVDFAELTGQSFEVRLSGTDPRDIPQLIQRLDDSIAWENVSAAANRSGQVVVKGTITGLMMGTG